MASNVDVNTSTTAPKNMVALGGNYKGTALSSSVVIEKTIDIITQNAAWFSEKLVTLASELKQTNDERLKLETSLKLAILKEAVKNPDPKSLQLGNSSICIDTSKIDNDEIKSISSKIADIEKKELEILGQIRQEFHTYCDKLDNEERKRFYQKWTDSKWTTFKKLNEILKPYQPPPTKRHFNM